MLQIRPDGSLAKPNDLRVRDTCIVKEVKVKDQLKNRDMRIPEILDKYDSVFHGIGKIRDNKNNNELYVRFSMKPGVVPVTQKPRQVPYYLLKPLEERLDQGLKSDIFEEVLQGTQVHH